MCKTFNLCCSNQFNVFNVLTRSWSIFRCLTKDLNVFIVFSNVLKILSRFLPIPLRFSTKILHLSLVVSDRNELTLIFKLQNLPNSQQNFCIASFNWIRAIWTFLCMLLILKLYDSFIPLHNWIRLKFKWTLICIKFSTWNRDRN